MTTDHKSGEVLANLKSTDPEFVLETIEKIRESGNVLILEGLIELLHDTSYPDIKKSILNLLSELKNKESIPALIAALKNGKYAAERMELVATCWQNGLSYNEYLPYFIDLVINETFLIAFEAFTVIENMYGTIENEIIEAESVKIDEALKYAGNEKAYLLNGLLTIIRDIPEIQEYSL